MHTDPASRPWYRLLYLQVLLAVVLGVVVGLLAPEFGKSLKPLGDGFIKLVKMMIAPIIFCTVVHGIASMGDLKKLGRVGAKSLLYFEVVSTFALIIGLVVVNLLQPGVGLTPPGQAFHADPVALDSGHVAEQAHALSTTAFALNLIPNTFLGAFVSGDLLQVLLIALLAAFAIAAMGERGKPLLHAIDVGSQFFFSIMGIVVKAAPIGAFGAMAFTVGSYGLHALNKLLVLMGGFYLTSLLFVVLVLGGIARVAGFSIFRYLVYIKHELLLVLGTSSSETALPGML